MKKTREELKKDCAEDATKADNWPCSISTLPRSDGARVSLLSRPPPHPLERRGEGRARQESPTCI